jgi:hypothetical protein|tara:strand:- start:5663 stop:6067 length:405 start_codon:yes stop_codon:yes gene_type:complete
MNLKKLQLIEQASKDAGTVSLSCGKYESYILYSIKIVKDNLTQDVQIYNTAANGDHYKIIEVDEFEKFTDKGWRYGVYVISLSNYRLKLDKIERRIKQEINGRANIKYIRILKLQRDEVLLKFSKINQKLNQLN